MACPEFEEFMRFDAEKMQAMKDEYNRLGDEQARLFDQVLAAEDRKRAISVRLEQLKHEFLGYLYGDDAEDARCRPTHSEVG